MKTHHLLEAIGFVEEQFLREAEGTPGHKAHPIRRIALTAAIISILVVGAMASSGLLKGLLNAGENGASVENLSSSMGNFLYHQDTVYYGTFGYIHKCDPMGNILKTYTLRDSREKPHYMFVSEDAVIYAADVASTELRVQPKDGSEPYDIDLGTGITQAYADGQTLYAIGEDATLYQLNLGNLEKTELLEDVCSYYVDNTYIYAVQTKNEKALYRSTKDDIGFEPIPLDFIPNKVIARGEALYICRWLDAAEQEQSGHRYKVSLLRNGEVIHLPVYSWFYQVTSEGILYLEEKTNALKCYNMTTGETKIIEENVFSFSVFEDRYICIEPYNEPPMIYDCLTEQCHPIITEA